MSILLVLLNHNLTEINSRTKAHEKNGMYEPHVSNFEVFMMKLKDFIKFMRAFHDFSLHDPDVKL